MSRPRRRAAVRRLRALGLGGAAAFALQFFGVGTAHADESPSPPRHLAPYGLDWIAYIAPEDLPPTRAAVCIVDSGLAVTPDTPPSSPDGPILERLATDGGSGEPQGPAPEQLHGTRMAMAAIAPANGWGTVGIWPGGRVVSVRAMLGSGDANFRADAYRRGIDLCRESLSRHRLVAINLSLSCDCAVDEREIAALEDRVAAAHAQGISLVAAAGNRADAPTAAPAHINGFFAVAAGSEAGELCPYASFDQAVAIVGPACPVDTADPLTGLPEFTLAGGSSAASLAASTMLGVLRTFRPDATYDQAESWLRTSARVVSGRRVLDGAAAARAAGLGQIVDRAYARMPRNDVTTAPDEVGDHGSTPGTATTEDPVPQGGLVRLTTPIAQVRWARGRLTIRAENRPRGTRIKVRASEAREFGLRPTITVVRRSSRFALRVRQRPDRVSIRYLPSAVDYSDRYLPSRLAVVKLGRRGRPR